MALKKKSGIEIVQETAETQLQIFDRAVRLFRAGEYSQARQVFEKAAQGSTRAIAHNARLHIIMCDRRLTKPETALYSEEDFYNVGVERLNARDMEGARKHFLRAVELTRAHSDRADHIYYAFAACCALSGDSSGAYENLKRAIEIQPRNRTAARHDPDFSGSAQQAALHSLLYPAASHPANPAPAALPPEGSAY